MGSGANIGDVSARLTLDSASFDAKLKASGEGLDRHAALTEKASARARAAWEKELVAQANAQQKLDQVNRSKELAALRSDILARSLEHEAEAVNSAGHAAVSQMQATSAAVRSLEGNPGIRAVERFLTTIPGVGKALMAAFPLVGAAAFGAVIVEMGAKVAEFIKTVRDMPKTIEQGFAALNLAQRTSLDELDLANDKLQNVLAKMAKKPGDDLKVAFDEAKLAADRLAGSIEASNNRLNELLSKNHINGLQVLWGAFGTKSTASREGTTKAFGAQADSNAYDLAEATGRGDTAAIEKSRKALLDTQNAQLAEARKNLAKEQGANNAQPGKLANAAGLVGGMVGIQVPTKIQPNNQAVIQDDKGIIATILNQQKEDAAQIRNAQTEAAKAAADKKKEAEEQAKQAAAERLRNLEAALAAEKLVRGESVKADYEYWQQKQAMFRAGSEQYNSVVQKQAELAVEGAKQAHEKIAQFEARQRSAPSNAEGMDIVARSSADSQRQAVQRGQIQTQDNVESNQLAILRARNEARQREAELTDAAGKSITRYAAALELAKVHAAEFEAEMRALESIRGAKALQQQTDPTRENGKALAEAQSAIVEAQARRQLQVTQDNVAVNGRDSSGLVGATDALEEFVRATRDSATELRNLTTNVLNSFNSEVVKAISTRGSQRQGFADVGAGLFRSVAGTALQKGEGSILGAIGFGGSKKPTGTASDPMHVMVANIQAFQAGLPQLPNLLPGLDTPLSNVPFTSLLPGGGGSGSSPSVGSMLGTALSLIPGFASGGMIDPNQWAIVGEEGPELFHSGGGGTIVPNDKIGGIGGGGDTHQWYIDARGATDPAQVHAQIMAVAPHIAAAAVKAGQEQRMRMPPSRR